MYFDETGLVQLVENVWALVLGWETKLVECPKPTADDALPELTGAIAISGG
jgi:hypothetical protein